MNRNLACLFLLASTIAPNAGLASASEWQNRLTCDEGLRIDYRIAGASYRVVLYGDALRHFVHSGAIQESELNAQGEFVHDLYANSPSFTVNKSNGRLVMSTKINRSKSDWIVGWKPHSDAGSQETDYRFYRCY